MTYIRIFKIIQLVLLALSIYFAAMKNTIYTILIMLSLFIEYTQSENLKLLTNREKIQSIYRIKHLERKWCLR